MSMTPPCATTCFHAHRCPNPHRLLLRRNRNLRRSQRRRRSSNRDVAVMVPRSGLGGAYLSPCGHRPRAPLLSRYRLRYLADSRRFSDTLSLPSYLTHASSNWTDTFLPTRSLRCRNLSWGGCAICLFPSLLSPFSSWRSGPFTCIGCAPGNLPPP